MRIRHRLALAFAAVALSGCRGIIGPQACTLIGCYSGLEVVLEGTPAVPFRIEAEIPGQPGRYVFDCPDASQCGRRAFFAEFTPDHVRIHVITASGTATHSVQPSYAEQRPNGPDCPPLCRTARVTIPLPASRSA